MIAEDVKPVEVNGEYYVPIVDHRAYLNVVEEWPTWFDNFHRHCAKIAQDRFGQVPKSIMNEELRPLCARMVQFDTQDGWMMVWRSEQDYLMFVLKWS